MDWEKVIFYGIIGIAVSLAMNFMNQGASQNIKENKSGEIELRMNKLYQVLGYMCIGITVIFILAALYYQDEEMYLMGGIMFLLFGGLGIPILMYYNNHRLRFNDERIVVQNWIGKTNEIKWSEINQIKFNPFSGYLKIRGSNNKITIHQHLVGLKEFLLKMEEKTKWKAKELKLPIKIN